VTNNIADQNGSLGRGYKSLLSTQFGEDMKLTWGESQVSIAPPQLPELDPALTDLNWVPENSPLDSYVRNIAAKQRTRLEQRNSDGKEEALKTGPLDLDHYWSSHLKDDAVVGPTINKPSRNPIRESPETVDPTCASPLPANGDSFDALISDCER
jgi:hypothetical protein